MKKKLEKTKVEPTLEQEIENLGTDTQTRLNKQFEQWGGGLMYRIAITSLSYDAKRIGLTLSQLATRLEDEGYIKIFNTPTGARWVFSGDCPMSHEEMQTWLQEQEMTNQTIREFKQTQRKQI